MKKIKSIFYDQKINKIREKCIEANKEIIELKFGCEVYFNDKTFGEPEHWGKICEWSGNPAPLNGFKVWTGLNRYVDIQKEDIAKIIGRQINLEDILRALEKTQTRNGKSGGVDEVFVGQAGQLIKYGTFGKLVTEYPNWILGKPLTEQSPEFINFIYEIFYGSENQERECGICGGESSDGLVCPSCKANPL